MDLGLQNKLALVTGGSRGLGRECALSLAREGARVAICGRTLATLEDTVDELKAQGADARCFVADISDDNSVGTLYGEIKNLMGNVDILVNNAGGTRSREDISSVSLSDFKGTFDLNVFGALSLMKYVVPDMKENKWGRIVNIASIWGREFGGNVSYMAAKAALIGVTKNAAISLAPHGILVNSIAPGSIAHPGGSWERFQEDNTDDIVDEFIDRNLPLGRFGWPQPVGDLVAFLSSDRAGLITGSCIVVDGGQSKSMI